MVRDKLAHSKVKIRSYSSYFHLHLRMDILGLSQEENCLSRQICLQEFDFHICTYCRVLKLSQKLKKLSLPLTLLSSIAPRLTESFLPKHQNFGTNFDLLCLPYFEFDIRSSLKWCFLQFIRSQNLHIKLMVIFDFRQQRILDRIELFSTQEGTLTLIILDSITTSDFQYLLATCGKPS